MDREDDPRPQGRAATNEPADLQRAGRRFDPRYWAPRPRLHVRVGAARGGAQQRGRKPLTDAAFNQGKPVPCPCFATGAKWPWAWTRDTACAVALGLADVALERSRATLLFKTSKKKTSLGGGAPRSCRTPARAVAGQCLPIAWSGLWGRRPATRALERRGGVNLRQGGCHHAAQHLGHRPSCDL